MVRGGAGAGGWGADGWKQARGGRGAGGEGGGGGFWPTTGSWPPSQLGEARVVGGLLLTRTGERGPARQQRLRPGRKESAAGIRANPANEKGRGPAVAGTSTRRRTPNARESGMTRTLRGSAWPTLAQQRLRPGRKDERPASNRQESEPSRRDGWFGLGAPTGGHPSAAGIRVKPANGRGSAVAGTSRRQLVSSEHPRSHSSPHAGNVILEIHTHH